MNLSAPDQDFEGYSVLEKLGQGGMGVVYKVKNLKLDRIEALKIISPTFNRHTQLLRRFEQEAKALARIHHPNIVTIYTLQESPAGQYITMEYVNGRTLGDRIGKVGVFDWKSSTDIVEQLLAAFAYAHKEGVLHRDIKPNNIMLTPMDQVKVMDFGLAKLYLNQDKTQSTHQAGTLAYMSPEQIKGEKLDQRSDIFAIGMTLYEMFSGRLPFDKDLSLFKIQKLIVEQEFSAPKDFNKNIPDGLSRLIMKALQKAPVNRYQSASDMLDAFKSFYQTEERGESTQETRVVSSLSSDPIDQEAEGSENVQVTELNSTWSTDSTYPAAEHGDNAQMADVVSSVNNESVSSRKSIRRFSPVLAVILMVSGTVWASIEWGPSMLQRLDVAGLNEQMANTNNGGLDNQENLQPDIDQPDIEKEIDETKAQDRVVGIDDEPTQQDDGDKLLAQNKTSQEQREGNPPSSAETKDVQPSGDEITEELVSSIQSSGPANLDPGQDADSLIALTNESIDDSLDLATLLPDQELSVQTPEIDAAPSPIVNLEESVRTEVAQWSPLLSEAIVSGKWDGLPEPVVNYYQDNINKLKRNFNILAATNHVDDSASLFSEEQSSVAIITRIEYNQKGREDRQTLPIPALWTWEKQEEIITLVDVREK